MSIRWWVDDYFLLNGIGAILVNDRNKRKKVAAFLENVVVPRYHDRLVLTTAPELLAFLKYDLHPKLQRRLDINIDEIDRARQFYNDAFMNTDLGDYADYKTLRVNTRFELFYLLGYMSKWLGKRFTFNISRNYVRNSQYLFDSSVNVSGDLPFKYEVHRYEFPSPIPLPIEANTSFNDPRIIITDSVDELAARLNEIGGGMKDVMVATIGWGVKDVAGTGRADTLLEQSTRVYGY